LIAIEGAQQQESFEVQAKVRIQSTKNIIKGLKHPEIEILYHRHYHEFDTYFQFKDSDQGLLRYREDEFIDANGKVSQVRYRLTHIGEARERDFPSGALLSRSRFIAPATHSLRFYREYFNPSQESFIEKDRLRWRIIFRGTTFYINIDRMDQPDIGTFLEIKSRTWSLKDAENKAELTHDLILTLGASPNEIVREDYVQQINTNDLDT
jgi:5-methylthioadenosine/S-adenosylhomocysteine deaminase